ncbi:MAG: TSUP family transporter [Gaiellaceae bacterium]
MAVALSSRLHYGRLGAIGLAGGLFSGLLGVGGGVVMVPLLVLWGGFGQRNAHAVSLGAIIPISAAGVLTFGAAGEIRVWEALALAVGAIAGAQAGARLLARVDERKLKLAFGVFMLIVAVLLVVEP